MEQELLRTGKRCFIVVDKGEMTGLVTPHEIKEIDKAKWPFTTLDDVMRPLAEVHSVSPDAIATERAGGDDGRGPESAPGFIQWPARGCVVALRRRHLFADACGTAKSSGKLAEEYFTNRPFSLLVLGGILATVALAAVSDPVHVDTGSVAGIAGKDPSVRIYKGIPFATPPVGDLRWRAPQPAAKWEGVRMADQFGPTCAAGTGGGGGGRGGRGGQGKGGAPKANPDQAKAAPPAGPMSSEDCLYLNVWTGAKSASDRLPVIVWNYGGGFTGGSGSIPGYDGEALAKRGAVVVTYNYRLGVFGFFAHPELTAESAHKASGNYGMMDLVATLKWVQKNIAAFGGDPKRVTIDGESAGAILVSAMVGSPEEQGPVRSSRGAERRLDEAGISGR